MEDSIYLNAHILIFLDDGPLNKLSEAVMVLNHFELATHYSTLFA